MSNLGNDYYVQNFYLPSYKKAIDEVICHVLGV